MINNDNQCSTNTVTNQCKTNSSQETMSTNSLNDPSVQNTNHDLDQIESQQQLTDTEPKLNTNDEDDNENTTDDEFIRITAAHQMLTEAQTFDEKKDYASALHLYRICVDLLLEELMFTEGTEQSRVYLREKCTAIMDRIDLLKKMLEPIPPVEQQPPTTTTTTTTNPPTEELNSLNLS